MKSPKTWAMFLIALIGVAAGAYGVWWLLAELLAWVTAQPSQIAAATIAFAGTVVAGIGAVVISQQRTKAREIAESHRPNKTELYMTFITEVVGMMRAGFSADDPNPDVMKHFEDFFFDFTTRAMLWGSPSVLQSYAAFRKAGDDPNILLLVDDTLQAMRKDLGLRNWGLSRGDLIKMLLIDPESVDALLTK